MNPDLIAMWLIIQYIIIIIMGIIAVRMSNSPMAIFGFQTLIMAMMLPIMVWILTGGLP